MFEVFKRLFFSRKFWVAVGMGGANAGVAQMNLDPEIVVMLMKALTILGSALIGGIAYEDGKTKEFGPAPIVVKTPPPAR